LQGGSILQYDLNGANTQVGSLVNDLTTGITTLTLDGILNITETTPNSFLSASFGDKWRLMNYSVSLTDNGLALGSTPALANGYTFKVDTSTPGQVNLMVIPEPSSAAWLAACSMMLLTRRRSRRAAKC
jgi:hypothetical protein